MSTLLTAFIQVIPCITLDDTAEPEHLGVPADDPAIISAGPPLIDLAGDSSLDNSSALSHVAMDISGESLDTLDNLDITIETAPDDHHHYHL